MRLRITAIKVSGKYDFPGVIIISLMATLKVLPYEATNYSDNGAPLLHTPIPIAVDVCSSPTVVFPVKIVKSILKCHVSTLNIGANGNAA